MKFKTILLLGILFCASHFSTFAQNFDSLKLELNKATLENNPHQFTILKSLTTAYTYANLDSALHYANIMIMRAKEADDKLNLAKSYNTLSDIYNMKGLYEDAIIPLEKSIEICNELKSSKGLISTYFLKGNILQNLHDYEAAEKAYLESLDLAKKGKDSLMMSKNIQGLGMNYDYMGKFDEAVQAYIQSIDISTKINDKYGLARAYTNIANVYGANKQADKAVEYFQKSIQVKKELKNYSGLSITYYNLAASFMNRQKYDEAEPLIDSTLLYGKKSNNGKMITYANQVKGNIYIKRKQFERALDFYHAGMSNAQEMKDSFLISIFDRKMGEAYLDMGNQKQAQQHFEAALQYSQNINNINLERSVLLQYINSLKKSGDYKKVSDFYLRVFNIKDTLFSKEKVAAINEIETKYQTEKKEAENELLKIQSETQAATIQNQRITLIGSVFGIGLLGLVAFLFYRQNQLQKKTNKLLADKNQKIETLHKELSHRVKNNLAFISGLMQLQGARLENLEAKRAIKEGENRIEAISLLHRKLFMEKEETDIDVGTYLKELCGNLQNTYPFETTPPHINVQADKIKIDGESAVRIGLIINELITNSFKYAFANHPQPNIDIQLEKMKNDTYQLTYQDNGKGLPTDLDFSQVKSLGLKLIQMLTKQLNGTLNMKNNMGASFKINFQNPTISV